MLLTPYHVQASGAFDIKNCPTSLPAIASSTTLTLFQKRICRTKLESCYSAFSKTLCDDSKNVFQLTLLNSDTEINPSATTSYNFKPSTKNISFNCFPKSYDKNFKRTPLSGDFTASGAYVENQDGCFYQPTLTTPNSTILKETNHLNGPLIGTYHLTYQFMPPSGSLKDDKITITVKDTTAPTINLNGDNPASPANPSSYNDSITVKDNYLPGLKDVRLTATFWSSSNINLGTVVFSSPSIKTSGSTPNKTQVALFTKKLSIPAKTSSISYSASEAHGAKLISPIVTRKIVSPCNASINKDFSVSGSHTIPYSCKFKLHLSGGGGGGRGAYSTSGGRSGGTTTVIHKRGSTTINRYTASGGAGGGRDFVFFKYSYGATTWDINQAKGDSFSQGGISGTGGSSGLYGPKRNTCPTGIVAGGNASGYSSGGGGGARANRGDPWWDEQAASYLEGGDSGNYTSVTIGSPQAGDTLVITIGSGGRGSGNNAGCSGEVEHKKGGNGAGGAVRIEFIP